VQLRVLATGGPWAGDGGAGNGIGWGGRILTCRHIAQPKFATDASWTVNGERVRVVSYETEEFWFPASSLERASRDIARIELDALTACTDWLASSQAYLPAADEWIDVIGFPARDDRQKICRVRVRVVDAESDEPIPPNLVFFHDPSNTLEKGFSGSFVGKFVPSTGHWRLVGLYAGSVQGDVNRVGIRKKIGVAVRPSEQDITWLMGLASKRDGRTDGREVFANLGVKDADGLR
jgi:hypothetical protein